MSEISNGIRHFVPSETYKRRLDVASKLLEPNGYDLAYGHARVSPSVQHTDRSQPDADSPTVVARNPRKRRSHANRMITPVHRYKYPMPKLDLLSFASRTRYSRLFRFIAGASFPTRPF